MAKRIFSESHWLNDSDPESQLNYLTRDPKNERKLRLFGVACCRRIWALLPTDECRKCVEAAERFADGGLTFDDMAAVATAAYPTYAELTNSSLEAGIAASYTADQQIHEIAFVISVSASRAASFKEGGKKIELAAHAALLREIFGNPFRPAAFSSSWRTSAAVGLAQQMYDARDFAALPILADALQDAGCEDADILSHCRSDGPHVRGCWVVDLVLGKQ